MKKSILLMSLFIGSLILFFSCKPDSDLLPAGQVEHFDTSNSVDDIPPILPSYLTNSNNNGINLLDSKIYRDDEYAIISEYLDLPNLTRRDMQSHFDFSLPYTNSHVNIDGMKATLGKVLFYDKELSIDGSTSCASCHKQENAFADNAAFSEGLNENDTDRNSFALGSFISLRMEYYGGPSISAAPGKLFWDERGDDVMDQLTQTFNNPKEMGMNEDALEARVNSKDYYKIIGRKAFGTDHLNHIQIKLAIAEFMTSIRTSKSPFDIAFRDSEFGATIETEFDNFSPSENLGKQLFNESCGTCHVSSLVPPINVSDFIRSANNGLDLVFTDQGIGGVTLDENDNGKFKIPSLRNLTVTGPYMHDGRFETIEEVVDFYNDGVQAHPNLNPELKDSNGDPIKLNLTNDEKEALVDFLHTLTDNNFLTDPIYSDPFKQ